MQSLIEHVEYWEKDKIVQSATGARSVPGLMVQRLKARLPKARRIAPFIRQRLDLLPLKFDIGALNAGPLHDRGHGVVPLRPEQGCTDGSQHVAAHEAAGRETISLNLAPGNPEVNGDVVFVL